MPDTHIKPRRPKSYFNPEHVSDNSEPDTDVEDLQLDANSSPASLTSSECSSKESDPASEPPSEAGEALFSPSLNTQRHQMVLEILSRELVKSVLDTGCNSLKFVSLVKNMTGVNLVIGVDLDKDILEEYKFLATPTASRWLDERPEDFVLEIWHGDVTDGAGAEVTRGRVEAVTSIELIEHLEPDMVESLTRTVLGVVRPRLWVVTTPNRDYNELFPDWPGNSETCLLCQLYTLCAIKALNSGDTGTTGLSGAGRSSRPGSRRWSTTSPSTAAPRWAGWASLRAVGRATGPPHKVSCSGKSDHR